MSFLLLLALVLVAGFVSIQIALPVEQRIPSQTYLLIAIIWIGLGLLAQLVLGFTLDETAAKIFFWARGSLALACLGQSLLLLFPGKPWMRWLSIALIVGSIALFALVFLSQVTSAEDWYSTSIPIYAQVGDLLATNRPTRWGSLAFNLYGMVTLLVGSISFIYIGQTKPLDRLWAVCVILGALGLLIPLYLPWVEANLFFFLTEMMSPILLFLGMRRLIAARADAK